MSANRNTQQPRREMQRQITVIGNFATNEEVKSLPVVLDVDIDIPFQVQKMYVRQIMVQGTDDEDLGAMFALRSDIAPGNSLGFGVDGQITSMNNPILLDNATIRGSYRFTFYSATDPQTVWVLGENDTFQVALTLEFTS